MYPESCKIANLVLLFGTKSRTIFFLDFLPKILEDIIQISIMEILPPETEGQMAYQPRRSTELCIAVGLHRVELTDLKCVNIDFDCKKAFDSTNWKTVITEMQKKAGCGELVYNYLNGRTFVYDVNGEQRFGFLKQKMGRGTAPGTKKGPMYFSIFQETDYDMNLSNPTWIWPGKFSDDKSPIATWDKLLGGQVQEGLDSTWRWSQDNFIDYHVTGPKRPKYYVFWKNTEGPPVAERVDLKMGSYPIERDYEKVQLGITIQYFKDDDKSNDWGYQLAWKGKKPLSRVSYELQNTKFIWEPSFSRMSVSAYVIGMLNYGASLYWCRASDESVEKARFDYINAMAAVCGLTAPEVLGLLQCRKGSKVKETNTKYLELCRFLNLPTLRDIAIKHAKRLMAQWLVYEPDLFETEVKDERISITSVKAPIGTLLHDLYKLSLQEGNDWYPEYTKVKKSGDRDKIRLCEQRPEWETTWRMCQAVTKEMVWTHTNTRCTAKDRLNTFWLEMRRRFKVLEMLERTTKRLDGVTTSKKSKRTSEDGPSDTPLEKRKCVDNAHMQVTEYSNFYFKKDYRNEKKTMRNTRNTAGSEVALTEPVKRTIESDAGERCTSEPRTKKRRIDLFSCDRGQPLRRGRKSARVCRICGYKISDNSVKIVTMKCCMKEAHVKCWISQKTKKKSGYCRDIKYYMKRDGVTPDLKAQPYTKIIDDPMDHVKCDLCEVDLAIMDGDTETEKILKKQHYMRVCAAVPGNVVASNPTRSELIERVASLGIIKRVGKKYSLVRARGSFKLHSIFVPSTAAAQPGQVPARNDYQSPRMGHKSP
jgi:hypothetical protein